MTIITTSHCEKNDDNNCNTDNVDQEVYARNECEIENENDDHSHDNKMKIHCHALITYRTLTTLS
jgi:hypothetical protein